MKHDFVLCREVECYVCHLHTGAGSGRESRKKNALYGLDIVRSDSGLYLWKSDIKPDIG